LWIGLFTKFSFSELESNCQFGFISFGPSWTPSTLAWQINLATITSPLIQYPVWTALKRFNLSKTIRWLAVFPLVIATFFNIIPLFLGENYVSNETYKWCSYVSYLFTGLTGVVFFSCVTRFSSTWFSDGERATSTGLACMMANLGGILPSLLGPQMVTDPFKQPLVSKDCVAYQIHLYLLIYFVLSVALFIIFWCHFPDNYDIVELSVNMNNSLKSDCLQVLSSWTVILIILVASLGSVPHIWGSTLLTVTLSRLKITQQFVGVVTTLSLITSTVFTIILTRLADVYFGQNLKKLIISFMPFHTLAMIALCVFILLGTPEHNYQYLIGLFYVIAIGVLNSVTPLILELGSELTHPVSEDIFAGIINQANNFVGVLFYLLFSYLTPGDWLLYLLMVIPVTTLLMFSMTKEFYNRRDNVEIAQ